MSNKFIIIYISINYYISSKSFDLIYIVKEIDCYVIFFQQYNNMLHHYNVLSIFIGCLNTPGDSPFSEIPDD